MPSLEISKKDLESLVGKKFKDAHELAEALAFAKTELDSVEGDAIKCSPSDTNRPDLYSAEGIARELKSRLGIQTGIPKYKVTPGKQTAIVEKTVEKVRPILVCAIVRNIHVTENMLIQMIQLQEKVSQTFGRRRKETGIGLYDFDQMKMPVRYKGFKDSEIEFTPLEFTAKMRPSEILLEHPKGKEFGHLLAGTTFYPMIIDAANQVASMPPIINSQLTGKVTEQTKNLFVEVTGFKLETCQTALNVMLTALADRGGRIESMKIQYPKGSEFPKSPIVTPSFDTQTMTVPKPLLLSMTGLALTDSQIVKLFSNSGFSAKKTKSGFAVTYPAYRQDILHPVDIIEDLLISIGYNHIEPLGVQLAVVGHEKSETKQTEIARDACIGMGLTEILTYNLTSIEKQTRRIGIKEGRFAQISNPVSQNYEIFRKNLYPEALEFLSKNKHAPYPQKIFEIGRTVLLDSKSETGVREPLTLSIVLASRETSFTEIKSMTEALARYLNRKTIFKPVTHPSFENGKSAEVQLGEKTGILGELNAQTRANFGLKIPVTALEVEI